MTFSYLKGFRNLLKNFEWAVSLDSKRQKKTQVYIFIFIFYTLSHQLTHKGQVDSWSRANAMFVIWECPIKPTFTSAPLLMIINLVLILRNCDPLSPTLHKYFHVAFLTRHFQTECLNSTNFPLKNKPWFTPDNVLLHLHRLYQVNVVMIAVCE